MIDSQIVCLMLTTAFFPTHVNLSRCVSALLSVYLKGLLWHKKDFELRRV